MRGWTSMGVKIGKDAKIGNNNAIGKNASANVSKGVPKNKNFAERHPILIGLSCSFVVGIALMFTFWSNIVTWIEGLF